MTRRERRRRDDSSAVRHLDASATSRVITINRPEARNAINAEVSPGHRGGDRPDRGRRRALGRRLTARHPCSARARTSKRSRPADGTTADGARRVRGHRRPRTDEADHRRRRGSGAGRRHRDLPGMRPHRRVHALQVRDSRGQARTGRRRRWLVPAAARLPFAIAMEMAMTGEPIDAATGPASSAWSTGHRDRRRARQRHGPRPADRDQRARRGAGKPRVVDDRRRGCRRCDRLAAVERGDGRSLVERGPTRRHRGVRREARNPSGLGR